MSGFDALEQMPDTELMLRVQWGSERAFAELYGRYFRRLLDFFYAMTRDVHLAEDLCHETFLRLWRLRVRYTASGAFAAYLFTVARHIWLERRRAARKEWKLGVAQRTEDEPGRRAPGWPSTPDEEAHRAEIGARILSALEQLPEEQRMAFVLRTVQGLSLDEIAQVMQCPVNTVRSRRLLAIQRLREALQGLLVL
jgi:RNA polymerase sigma-70 factor (ECF subfamily)